MYSSYQNIIISQWIQRIPPTRLWTPWWQDWVCPGSPLLLQPQWLPLSSCSIHFEWKNQTVSTGRDTEAPRQGIICPKTHYSLWQIVFSWFLVPHSFLQSLVSPPPPPRMKQLLPEASWSMASAQLSEWYSVATGWLEERDTQREPYHTQLPQTVNAFRFLWGTGTLYWVQDLRL